MNSRRWILHLVLLASLGGWPSCPRAALAQSNSSGNVWSVLTFDPKGDGRDPALADAAQLSYRYDKEKDLLWFRVSLYGAPNEQAFGINLIFDTGGDDASKMNWWGANKAFKFDRLVTAWVTRSDSGYRGTIGVGDIAGVNSKQFNNLLQNNLQIRTEGDAIIIGVRRTDISNKLKMNLIASVGSNEQWNDDLPNAGSVTIDLAAERPKPGLRELDFSRNNFELPASYKTLPHSEPPLIKKSGQGKETLILIPGMYSGAHSFDEFIARNQTRYTFYTLTPPGINGTPPRPEPAIDPRLGELIWTRLLERDILNLIRQQKINKPVIVAERHPGSIAAMELAIEHPDEVGGVILVGTNLVQAFPSPKDPARKTPIAFSDRAPFIEETWAAKWFKFVTPETWNSNDLPATLLTSDVAKSQRAWQEFEAAPIEVKIRYLCEFWASDVTTAFDKLQAPVLALIPTFDEKFLADPTNSFAKNSIVGSWDTLIPKHPKVTLVRIPEARLFLLDDQPKKADEAIAAFFEQLGAAQKK